MTMLNNCYGFNFAYEEKPKKLVTTRITSMPTTNANHNRYCFNTNLRGISFILNMNLIFITTVLILLSLSTTSIFCARTRLRNTLDVKFNLGCELPECNSSDPDKAAVNLFQVVSSNSASPEKTNFIYSNINGPPMVITTSSSQESSLLIDWGVLLKNATQHSNNNDNNNNNSTPTPSPPIDQVNGFHFNVTQDGAIGILIEKIIFFDDTDQSGILTKDKPYFEIQWSDIIWDLATRTTYHKDDFLKTHFRLRPEHRYFNGNFSMRLGIPRDYKADRQREIPHLKLNNQSILIVINIDGIQTPPNYQNVRLAMSFVVVVQTPNGRVSLDTVSDPLISDEYTPGVFRIKSLQFKTKQEPSSTPSLDQIAEDSINDFDANMDQSVQLKKAQSQSDKLGFLYWKEVAYTDRRKIISRTIDVFDTETPITMDLLPNISQPFYQYFTYKPAKGPVPKYRAYRFDLVFGKENSSYNSTKFTDFSFVLGLGAAPQELMFSFLVKIIIFVCFCLPIIVMLGGLIYLMFRRLNGYGDTELLLAAES